MGLRGQTPMPTVLKKLIGSHHAYDNSKEPNPNAPLPPAPKWLQREAKAVYRQFVENTTAMGVGKKPDIAAAIRYSRMWVEWRQLDLFIQEVGTVYFQRDGSGEVANIKPLPQVAQRDSLAQQLLQIEREFGLTPAARTRIKVEVQPTTLVVPSRLRCLTN